MLRDDLAGIEYSKSAHRHKLAPRLHNRSNGSIEFKHQNISAVLIRLGLPYIDGYKPRGNYQALLARAVEAFLTEHPSVLPDIQAAPRVSPDQPAPPIADVGGVFEPPPDQIIVPSATPTDWRQTRPRRIDFARRDADNRKLGALGEQFVVDVERRRLLEARRDDLSAKVRWVAQDFGDGAGFDVLTFDEATDAERLVEVKTTGLGKFFPFYVTANEVRCSQANADAFHLYRVFDFAVRPRLYVLRGALSETCRLEPTEYRASLGAS